MDHVAILKKSWKLKEKILSGEKTIESRWYAAKVAPWDRINAGDVVYFKESGEPVSVKADVEKVLQFADLSEEKIKEILVLYGSQMGVGDSFFEKVNYKQYCILVFLKDVEEINPFNINKAGFGNMAAWLCGDISSLKRD